MGRVGHNWVSGEVMVATGWGQDLEGRDRDLGRSDSPIKALRGIGTLDAQVLGSNPLSIQMELWTLKRSDPTL